MDPFLKKALNLDGARICPTDDSVCCFLYGNVDQVDEFYKTETKNHIWHKSGLQFKFKTNFAHGVCCFGECLSDEWFIVSLMMKLTKNSKLIVSVSDSDGEFLLIEAAHFIPKWLDPENSTNRVFLSNGQIHIIPKCIVNPSLQDAIKFITDHPDESLASKQVQEAIQQKTIRAKQESETKHWVKCCIPHKIASILHHCPQMISMAIEALFCRDPIAMRAASKMKYFPPKDLVKCSVMFTRALYAKLKYVPLQSKSTICDVGTRISLGFEMILNDETKHEKFGDSTVENELIKLIKMPLVDLNLLNYRESDDENWMNIEDFEENTQQFEEFDFSSDSCDSVFDEDKFFRMLQF